MTDNIAVNEKVDKILDKINSDCLLYEKEILNVALISVKNTNSVLDSIKDSIPLNQKTFWESIQKEIEKRIERHG